MWYLRGEVSKENYTLKTIGRQGFAALPVFDAHIQEKLPAHFLKVVMNE